MTQQKIKELLIKTFGEEEANDPDVIRLYTDCLRQAVEEVTNEQSLLDDFAKAAMQSIMSSDHLRSAAVKDSREHGMSHVDFVAQCAYDIASAMMKERERRMKE